MHNKDYNSSICVRSLQFSLFPIYPGVLYLLHGKQSSLLGPRSPGERPVLSDMLSVLSRLLLITFNGSCWCIQGRFHDSSEINSESAMGKNPTNHLLAFEGSTDDKPMSDFKSFRGNYWRFQGCFHTSSHNSTNYLQQ